jgi:transcription termination factor Rho
VLSRHVSERRIYPVIDVTKSGTRKEELMSKPETLQKVWALRNAMQSMEEVEGLKFLFSKMKKTKTNEEFLNMMNE